jgi:hypothetical protein
MKNRVFWDVTPHGVTSQKTPFSVLPLFTMPSFYIIPYRSTSEQNTPSTQTKISGTELTSEVVWE